jgi:hypothetical protein
LIESLNKKTREKNESYFDSIVVKQCPDWRNPLQDSLLFCVPRFRAWKIDRGEEAKENQLVGYESNPIEGGCFH